MTTEEKTKRRLLADIQRKRAAKKRRQLRRKISALTLVIAVFAVSAGAIYSAGAKEITVTEINEFQGINEAVTIKTRCENVGEVLKETGHSVGELDKISKPINSDISDNDNIVIKRGKQIKIKHSEGVEIVNITTADATDALIEAGYIPGELDEISHDGATLADSETIEVTSISTIEETYKSEISFTTEYVEDNSLAKGTTRVLSEGRNGSKTVKCKVGYKNGEEISCEIISEDIITPAKNKVVAKGTKTTSVNSDGTVASAVKKSAPSESGKTINGMKYKKKITMTATAYSTSPSENGGYTVSAMGNPLGFGIAAVDPSIIPLGSKIYVTSTDGTWSYGVASAEDTGGAIKGNRIDLCFNGTVKEVNKFGRRSCVVYVLE